MNLSLLWREGPSPRWWGVASLLVLGLALAWPFEMVRWGLVIAMTLTLLGLTLALPQLSAQAVALFVFLGILTAVEVGFSFKAPQFFSLLAVCALAIRWCLGWRPHHAWPWAWALPFVWIGLSWLPSLMRVEVTHLALNQDMTGIRLLLNYALLLLTALVLFASVTSVETLWNRILLLLCSCVLSLGVGWLQQIGYYSGLYNPLEFIGKHGSLVDFYGPFLRISPGTFANEYGEILQTVGILLMGLLYLDPQRFQGRVRLCLHLLLAWVVASLVINFTRASWLVFITGAFFLLALARPPLWRLGLLGGMFYGIFAGLFYLSQLISDAGLLVTVGQRFGELSDVTVDSAGQRLESWGLAWQYFVESPWIGNGLGRFVNTHNVPLQLLAETGVLGFGVFYAVMAWLSWTFWRAWKGARYPALKDFQMIWLVAFWGCLAFDLTNHGIFHFVLWVCIAMGLATARLNFEEISKGAAVSPLALETV